MTAKLSRRIAMLRRTLTHFDEHPDDWTAIEPIADQVAVVRDGTAAIERDAKAQAAATPKGITEARDDARDIAETRLASLGRRVTAYAIVARDPDLREAVNVTRAQWDDMPEQAFFNRAADALTRTDAVLDKLARYGVDKSTLAAVRAAVDAARPLTAARDNVAADRGGATERLSTGYTALVEPLDVLDFLVPELVESPEFVAEYRRVRRISGD